MSNWVDFPKTNARLLQVVMALRYALPDQIHLVVIDYLTSIRSIVCLDHVLLGIEKAKIAPIVQSRNGTKYIARLRLHYGSQPATMQMRLDKRDGSSPITFIAANFPIEEFWFMLTDGPDYADTIIIDPYILIGLKVTLDYHLKRYWAAHTCATSRSAAD